MTKRQVAFCAWVLGFCIAGGIFLPTTQATPKTSPAPSSSPIARWNRANTLLLRGGTVWTATGQIIKNGDVLIRDGKIAAVGQHLQAKGAIVIDAKGKHITPGIIDTHSHIGVYASPSLRATSDGNEAVRPVTAYARAEHSVWPQDPAIPRAVAGGTTTAQILPGSANLIGGRTVTVKFRLARTVHEMKFPQAPYGLKMACGENPKRVHRSLATRMGNYAGYRRAYQKAVEYQRRWKAYEKKLAAWKKKKAKQNKSKRKQPDKKAPTSKPTSRPIGKTAAKANEPPQAKANETKPTPKQGQTASKASGTKQGKAKVIQKPTPPSKNHDMETLRLVLEGKILVHMHCYRADEMLDLIRLSKEFGFKIRSFHHAIEAYKIRDHLAKENISASVWADWWGFKIEAYDTIQENAPMLAAAGVRTILHSDSATGIQRLNQESAKAYYRGKAMGLKLPKDAAIRWITINPAWALGIDHLTGSLTPGKMADIVLWNGHPLSVYTRTQMVFIDGKVVFHRKYLRPRTDFEVGQGPLRR